MLHFFPTFKEVVFDSAYLQFDCIQFYFLPKCWTMISSYKFIQNFRGLLNFFHGEKNTKWTSTSLICLIQEWLI